MAIVNVSLDTASRQAVLTIDGVMISVTDVFIEKYIYDGETIVRFSYTVETIDSNGLKERRQFFLPSLEDIAAEVHADVNEDGFASKIVHDDEKAKADIIDFIKQGRNPQ